MARVVCTYCKRVKQDSDDWVNPTISLRLDDKIWTQKYPLHMNICDECRKKSIPFDFWAFPHQPGTSLEASFKRFMAKLKRKFPEWDGKV